VTWRSLLTLCLKIACANPEYGFRYPRDFSFLTELSGGARLVEAKHYDRNTISRWGRIKKTVKPTAQYVQDAFNLKQYKLNDAQKVKVATYLRQFPAPAVASAAPRRAPGPAPRLPVDSVPHGMPHEYMHT
jgi:hypothetical protein